MRDRAPPIVDVCNKNPERALPKARPDELRLAETCLRFGETGKTWPIHPLVHRVPKRKPVRIARVVGLEGHNVRCPTRRNGHPVGLSEKEWLREDTAADLKIAPIGR